MLDVSYNYSVEDFTYLSAINGKQEPEGSSCERNDEAAVTCSNHEQTPPMLIKPGDISI
jgi:hypothetical protein